MLGSPLPQQFHANRPDPYSKEAIGERLLHTRQALGFTTTEMCRLMGSSTAGSAYSNYEMGRRRISLDHAFALCASCSLTMDWIYRGDARQLPPDLREKIQRIRLKSGRPAQS